MAATVSKQLTEAARRHIYENVPLSELNLTMTERNRIERVEYILFLLEKEPDMDIFAKLKRLAAGRYDTAMEEWHAAKRDMMLYDALTMTSTKR